MVASERRLCFPFGRTPEGWPMMALAVTRTGALTAAAALQRKVPDDLVPDLVVTAPAAGYIVFFARRHASWDERLDLYPAMRTAQPL